MGTAASAQSEQVQAASAADVEAVVGQLSQEDRKKLKDALLEGTYLAQYFDKAEQQAQAIISDQDKLLSMAMDAEAKQKVQEESKAWYEAEAKPLLEKAFHQYNTSGERLDSQEAAVFFSHMVGEETLLAKGLSLMSLQGLTPEEREEIRPHIEHQVKMALAASSAKLKEKQDTYVADKAAHNAAAFKVLDVNGDGTLSLTEFLAAFEPDTDRNRQFNLALGYMTAEEVEQQNLIELRGADAYRRLHTAVVARCEG